MSPLKKAYQIAIEIIRVFILKTKPNITLGDSTTRKLITNLKFVQTKKKKNCSWLFSSFFFHATQRALKAHTLGQI